VGEHFASSFSVASGSSEDTNSFSVLILSETCHLFDFRCRK